MAITYIRQADDEDLNAINELITSGKKFLPLRIFHNGKATIQISRFYNVILTRDLHTF